MTPPTCPMAARDVLGAAFLDNRARLLELAAFLDRIDRAANPEEARADYRYRALLLSLEALRTAPGGRAKAILDLLSDPTAEPRESAAGLKGAYGAWDGGAP